MYILWFPKNGNRNAIDILIYESANSIKTYFVVYDRTRAFRDVRDYMFIIDRKFEIFTK